MWPTDPCHQRRRVHWPNVCNADDCAGRTGHPAPDSADNNPPAVMKRRIAPGLIFHPCPTPGANPDPVAVAIRRPAHYRHMRKPDIPIVWNRPPAAVVVEVLIADDVFRNVAAGCGTVFALVSLIAPLVKVVVLAVVGLHIGA